MSGLSPQRQKKDMAKASVSEESLRGVSVSRDAGALLKAAFLLGMDRHQVSEFYSNELGPLVHQYELACREAAQTGKVSRERLASLNKVIRNAQQGFRLYSAFLLSKVQSLFPEQDYGQNLALGQALFAHGGTKAIELEQAGQRLRSQLASSRISHCALIEEIVAVMAISCGPEAGQELRRLISIPPRGKQDPATKTLT